MKVRFDVSRGRIEIEGDGPDLVSLLQLVREIAPKLSEIRLITDPSGAAKPSPNTPPLLEDQTNHNRSIAKAGVPTLREFARSLSPGNIAECIVVIGAYVARYDNQDSFSPKEMADWFTICGFQKPSQMPVALFSAKKRYGFLENPGHGRWRLSTAGENVVTRMIERAGGQ